MTADVLFIYSFFFFSLFGNSNSCMKTFQFISITKMNYIDDPSFREWETEGEDDIQIKKWRTKIKKKEIYVHKLPIVSSI